MTIYITNHNITIKELKHYNNIIYHCIKECNIRDKDIWVNYDDDIISIFANKNKLYSLIYEFTCMCEEIKIESEGT